MKNITYYTLLSFMLIIPSAQADINILPKSLSVSLHKAYGTQDSFIIDAVTSSAKANHPEMSQAIDQFIQTLSQGNPQEILSSTHPTPAQLSSITPAAGDKKDDVKTWAGNVEFGAILETGNTETEDLNGSAKLIYKLNDWLNTLKLKAASGKENDRRNSEEYRLHDQLRLNISERDYTFGEFEYVNDRFSGYDYRIAESLGYGYHLIKEDDMKLSSEVSIGARQSSLSDGENENSFLGKVGGNFLWGINQNLTFTQDLSVSIASDATITESATAFKSTIVDSLYLKLGFDVEHISDVPASSENTDTVTSLKVGYDF